MLDLDIFLCLWWIHRFGSIESIVKLKYYLFGAEKSVMKSKILIAFFSIVVLITFSNFQQAQTMVGNSKATNGPNSGSDYSPPATSSTHYVNGVGAGANDAGNGGQGNVALVY